MLTFLSHPISSHTYLQRHNSHDTLPERESLWQRLTSWLWGFISHFSDVAFNTGVHREMKRSTLTGDMSERGKYHYGGRLLSDKQVSLYVRLLPLMCNFYEEIWTDIWSLRIGFQQQIEVTIPLKSSLFSQWVCWAYIQSMDERLLAGALVTQT